MHSAILSLILAFTFFATAQAQTPKAELSDMSQTWNEVKPGGGTICARGEEFSFFVYPGRTEKIIIDFIGGGACWNAETCAKATATFTDSVDEIREMHKEGLSGIYDKTKEENPVKDWTHVVVPYCSGDIHWGNKEVNYTDEDGKTINIQHKGAVNAKSVIDWVSEQFTAPEKVLVTGCSAGAYGSIYWTPHVRKIFPESKLYQFADSGIGVITEGFLSHSLETWNATAAAASWIPDLDPATNDWSKMTVANLYDKVGNFHPDIKLSEATSQMDLIQTFFYELMGGEGENWSPLMRQNLEQVANKVDNFNYFITPGEEHCLLPYDYFYEVSSDGKLFSEWFKEYIDGEEVENVDCESCPDPMDD